MEDVIAVYERDAEALAERYERIEFERVHCEVLELLPKAGASVLDVGAGSGRDAAWFAANGYQVTAVEPSSKPCALY
ncbi:MAG: methyltransferase domain-containing protein [Gammaproteobacteria bacterium]|nr:methyltransferase domain-containing protein [Gammaproteobacteria bacterium]